MGHQAFMEYLTKLSWAIRAQNYQDTGGLMFRNMFSSEMIPSPSPSAKISQSLREHELQEWIESQDKNRSYTSSKLGDDLRRREQPFEAFNPVNLECSVSI